VQTAVGTVDFHHGVYKKIFILFSGSKSFGKCPNEIKLEVHPVRK
jgi:hypothetical protein